MIKARKEFTASNLYSKIKIMKKKTIAIIQCILYLIRLRSVLFAGLSLFITLKNCYIIFPKNYNFLEKYTSLCYTTSRLI